MTSGSRLSLFSHEFIVREGISVLYNDGWGITAEFVLIIGSPTDCPDNGRVCHGISFCDDRDRDYPRLIFSSNISSPRLMCRQYLSWFQPCHSRYILRVSYLNLTVLNRTIGIMCSASLWVTAVRQIYISAGLFYYYWISNSLPLARFSLSRTTRRCDCIFPRLVVSLLPFSPSTISHGADLTKIPASSCVRVKIYIVGVSLTVVAVMCVQKF